MFSIGATAWFAGYKTVERTQPCNECFGQLFLTVILGDGSQVTIDCAGCARGYDPPLGVITYHEGVIDVRQVIIERVEITVDVVEYGFSSCYRSRDLFATQEEAEQRATGLVEQHDQEEKARVFRKEKNNRSWSWHVHYHRDCIRRLQKDLVYHEAKLKVADERSGSKP